ncbi:MAG TPA: hypothetical protein V6D50_07760 [Chroococcales cyanobacterium]
MEQDKSSSKETTEIILKVLSVVAKVILFIAKWLLIIIVWMFFFSLGITLSLIGIKIPEPPRFVTRKRRQRFDPEKFRREFQNLKLEEIIKNFDEQLEQLEQLERKGKLDPKQENVVRKLRNFDRSKYDRRLRDIFEEDELEELILLILILLGS